MVARARASASISMTTSRLDREARAARSTSARTPWGWPGRISGRSSTVARSMEARPATGAAVLAATSPRRSRATNRGLRPGGCSAPNTRAMSTCPDSTHSSIWPDSPSTTRRWTAGKRRRTSSASGTVSIGPSEVGMPITAGPLGAASSPRISSRKDPICSTSDAARSARRWPLSVGTTPRAVRWTSGQPNSSSSRFKCRLSAGCATCSASAARVSEPCSTMPRK